MQVNQIIYILFYLIYCTFNINIIIYIRYEVTSLKDGASNGLLLCNLYNYNDREWVIRSRGYFSKNTPSSLEAIPVIKSVLSGNLSDISLPIDDWLYIFLN